jgi:hypothetical protein
MWILLWRKGKILNHQVLIRACLFNFSTLNFSTLNFSTLNFSTLNFSTLNFSTKMRRASRLYSNWLSMLCLGVNLFAGGEGFLTRKENQLISGAHYWWSRLRDSAIGFDYRCFLDHDVVANEAGVVWANVVATELRIANATCYSCSEE